MLESLWKPRGKNGKIQAAAVVSDNNRTTHLRTKFVEIIAAPTGGAIRVISLLNLHLLVAITVLVLSSCLVLSPYNFIIMLGVITMLVLSSC